MPKYVPPGCRVVALWAIPRSVSTAFEKAFSRRSDTRIVHEPFTDCYYFSGKRKSDRYGNQPAKANFTGVAAARQVMAQTASLIFIKDLAFQAEPYVPDAFLREVCNTFIIRHPDAVLRSLLPLKPDFTEDEFGFTSLARLFVRVTNSLGQSPVVVDGTHFRVAPTDVLGRYCEIVGVSFQEAMLHWPDGRIKRWGPDEELSQARWHRRLESSHSILPPEDASSQPAGKGDQDLPASLIPRDIYEHALEIYGNLSRFVTPGLKAVVPG